MGFWNRVKDVLVSGPTTAVKNERVEDAVGRATEAAGSANNGAADKVKDRINPPEPKVEAPKAPEAPAAPADPAPETTPVAEEYRVYTVKSGDTLSEIAASYGVDWHEMARLNELENPDLIFPGQVFKVPN